MSSFSAILLRALHKTSTLTLRASILATPATFSTLACRILATPATLSTLACRTVATPATLACRTVATPATLSTLACWSSSITPCKKYTCTPNVAPGTVKRFSSSKTAEETVNIMFIDRDGDGFNVKAKIGDSLMKTAHKYDIDLEGACDGTLSCCTCHLVVHPDWFEKLGSEPCEDELDMLDMAYGLTDTSRLGCQVKVHGGLDGLIVRIPAYEPQYT